MSVRVVTLAMVAALHAALVAQQPAGSPRFDVVSIKPNNSGNPRSGFRTTPAGRLEWTNITVGTIVSVAHQRFPFDDFDVIGAPAWVGSERFDIIAQTAPGAGAPGLTADVTAMLRAMLADRFGLAAHWEQRQRAVYALVVARPGAPPGPGLHRTEAGCGEGVQALTGGGRGSMRPGRGPNCTFGGGPGNVQGNAVTVQMFGRMIGSEVRRPVIDRTGLTGSFDIDLRYRPDFGIRPDGPPPAPLDPDAPSIFTAVEEQLGLKLVSERAPVDVLVIDRLERPTPD
jgi:uncharacterized protein (TIGR03435 family)